MYKLENTSVEDELRLFTNATQEESLRMRIHLFSVNTKLHIS